MERLLTLDELSAETGVSPRNIRYYTAEGLLPAPEARGRYALYTDEHLERLQLILKLKESFLPLGEIQAQLDAAFPKGSKAKKSAAGSASEYVARVMRERNLSIGKATPPAVPKPAASSPMRAKAELPKENWTRIVLADGVELHLREPQPPKEAALLKRLVQVAESLFNLNSNRRST